MTSKKLEEDGLVQNLFHEKRRRIEENRRDFLKQVKLATEEALWVMLVSRPNIDRAFHENPMETRQVVVYSSNGIDYRVRKEDVEEAARLLCHPAMGFPVIASAQRHEGKEIYVITYHHKSIVED